MTNLSLPNSPVTWRGLIVLVPLVTLPPRQVPCPYLRIRETYSGQGTVTVTFFLAVFHSWLSSCSHWQFTPFRFLVLMSWMSVFSNWLSVIYLTSVNTPIFPDDHAEFILSSVSAPTDGSYIYKLTHEFICTPFYMSALYFLLALVAFLLSSVTMFLRWCLLGYLHINLRGLQSEQVIFIPFEVNRI